MRKNYAEYPPTADRPAVRHDDLMIIYFDRASNQIRANYCSVNRDVKKEFRLAEINVHLTKKLPFQDPGKSHS